LSRQCNRIEATECEWLIQKGGHSRLTSTLPPVTRLAVGDRKGWTESLCLWTSAGGCKLDLRIARVATCAEDHLKNPAKLHRRRVRGRSSPPRDMAVWPD
jgi:hypothetical protein